MGESCGPGGCTPNAATWPTPANETEPYSPSVPASSTGTSAPTDTVDPIPGGTSSVCVVPDTVTVTAAAFAPGFMRCNTGEGPAGTATAWFLSSGIGATIHPTSMDGALPVVPEASSVASAPVTARAAATTGAFACTRTV